MRRSSYVIVSVATLGLFGLAVWAYRKFRVVNPDSGAMSAEWLSTAEYNKEGFVD